MRALVTLLVEELRISLGNLNLRLPLNLFLISFNHDLTSLHDGQRDRKVLVRVDVSKPVFDRGGKLDLLEHVFACLLEDELDHFLRVHAQEPLAAFGVAVPLPTISSMKLRWLLNSKSSQALFSPLVPRDPLDRIQLGTHFVQPLREPE